MYVLLILQVLRDVGMRHEVNTDDYLTAARHVAAQGSVMDSPDATQHGESACLVCRLTVRYAGESCRPRMPCVVLHVRCRHTSACAGRRVCSYGLPVLTLPHPIGQGVLRSLGRGGLQPMP